jgi:cytochrome c oxidase subunit 2
MKHKKESRTMRQNSLVGSFYFGAILLAGLAAGWAGAAVRARPSAEPSQGTGSQPVVEIRLTAERFSFTPSLIKVAAGTIVEVVAESEDTTHGFHLADAGIDEQIPARGKGELRLRFEATQAGTYFFECSRPCGAGHNTMRGTIIVEE